jgi:hypothetical protein
MLELNTLETARGRSGPLGTCTGRGTRRSRARSRAVPTPERSRAGRGDLLYDYP